MPVTVTITNAGIAVFISMICDYPDEAQHAVPQVAVERPATCSR